MSFLYAIITNTKKIQSSDFQGRLSSIGICLSASAFLARLRLRRSASTAKMISPQTKVVTPTPNAALRPMDRELASALDETAAPVDVGALAGVIVGLNCSTDCRVDEGLGVCCITCLVDVTTFVIIGEVDDAVEVVEETATELALP
jgi:hypothetical protein